MKVFLIAFGFVSVLCLLEYLILKAFRYESKKLKEELKKNNEVIQKANQTLETIQDTHEKITEKPNSVGFNNGINLLHDYAQKK